MCFLLELLELLEIVKMLKMVELFFVVEICRNMPQIAINYHTFAISCHELAR